MVFWAKKEMRSVKTNFQATLSTTTLYLDFKLDKRDKMTINLTAITQVQLSAKMLLLIIR